MKRFISILFCLLIASPAFGQSSLGALANSMVAGSWAELQTNNIGVLTQPGADGNIISYAADGGWDSVLRKFSFIGNDHIDGNTSQGDRFVIYDDATNTWTNMPPPPWSAPGNTDHAYFHHGVDPTTGAVFRRANKEGGRFYKWLGGAWTALPVVSVETGYACCGAVEYFPELGGLVFIQGGEIGGASVYLFTESTQQWAKLADNMSGLNDSTSMMGAYSAVAKVMVFGQNGNFFKLDATRTITRLNNPPVLFYDGSGILGNMVADPVTGQFIFLTVQGRQAYSYDVATDTWSMLMSTGKPNLSGWNVVSVPVSNYGVVMYTACSIGNCKVLLYKHSGSSTPPPDPNPPASDFMTRCAAAGVVKCIGFDTPAEIAGNWGINPVGIVPGSTGAVPSIDTVVKASGGGSMKMTVPQGQVGGVSGSFYANFSNDYSVQFGENTEFYIQYRQRNDSGYMTALGSVGMKQDIVGTGSTAARAFASCTDLEFVTQNSNVKQVPQWYQNCGRYEPLNVQQPSSPYSSPDFLIQNGQSVNPGCWHYAPTLASRIPPNGNCIPFRANQWSTRQKHVKVGPLTQIGGQWWFANSFLDVWEAAEGQPSFKVLQYGPYNIGPLPEGNTQKYGQIWLLMYSGDGVYPVAATTWYDELIISRNKIDDPSGTVTPPNPPANPCVDDPLKISGVKWPTSRTGNRNLTWNSGNREIVSVAYTWPLNGTQAATFKDKRDCSLTVTR